MKKRMVFVLAVISLFTISYAITGSYADKPESAQNDNIAGTEKSDTFNTGGGDDNIHSGAGDDRIISGSGDDLVSAGPGDDRIKDGAGDDYVIADEGNDVVVLGAGNDYINLGPGDDTIVINLDQDIGEMNFIDGGEGFDKVIFVTDEVDGIVNNEIVQYYEKEKVYGRKIIDMGGVNIAAGLTGIEQVGMAASFTF